jgi:hypothetical protein
MAEDFRMNAKDKILATTAMAMLAASEATTAKTHYGIENPYANLGNPPMYVAGSNKPYRKSKLTPKQKKARAKSKLAKKSRKRK